MMNHGTKEDVTGVRLFICGLTFFLSLFCLSGCAGAAGGQSLRALEAMTAVEDDLPAGNIYLLGEQTGNAARRQDNTYRGASDALLAAAFSAGDVPWELCEVDDGAMRFSTKGSPCEFIVLHCVNRSDTDDVAALLAKRLAMLERAWRGDDAQSLVAQGEVVIVGRYVMLIISANPDRAQSAAVRVLS